MNEDNKKPNPAEEYMSKIIGENNTNTEHQEDAAGPTQSPITGEAFEKRKPVFNPLGRVEDIENNEVKIADIRKHFFGLFLVYLQVVLGIGLSLGLIVFLLPDVIGSSNSTVNAGLAIVSLFFIVLGVIFLMLATKMYQANQLIITDVNVTQVMQIGLFDRKVSELTMKNVEDVTAEQKGIFPTIFNYGTLKVETAGEQNNFTFKYCPNPNAYAKALQDARIAYLDKHSVAH